MCKCKGVVCARSTCVSEYVFPLTVKVSKTEHSNGSWKAIVNVITAIIITVIVPARFQICYSHQFCSCFVIQSGKGLRVNKLRRTQIENNKSCLSKEGLWDGGGGGMLDCCL